MRLSDHMVKMELIEFNGWGGTLSKQKCIFLIVPLDGHSNLPQRRIQNPVKHKDGAFCKY